MAAEVKHLALGLLHHSLELGDCGIARVEVSGVTADVCDALTAPAGRVAFKWSFERRGRRGRRCWGGGG